ncbi:tyrosine-type recombinase/integrase [Paucilactobacillus vaccinostercus]|uniref:tyrosine-type recombinase/integrase n=1 Tax=Paucilactobacillus vaccinostercus TaxID=176291 RepID=UPI00070F261B|nr:site-specific integrase [Paucilactobacillus vaccinostercus]
MAYIYKRANLWHFRVNRSVNGKRLPINSNGGYRLRSMAKEAAQEIEDQIKHGTYQEPTDQTFDRYYEEWFHTFYEGKKSAANDNHYRSALKKIKKYFPNKKIADISRSDYQNFLNEFGKEHAPATVLKAHVYIAKCFHEAYHFGAISIDPTYEVSLTGDTSLEKDESHKFMNLDDFKTLIQYTYTHLDPRRVTNYIILVMANTGMRFEEADGLTWDCIDFDNATIKIDKTWNYTKKPYGFGPTKNQSSMRSIHVDKQTLGVLRKLKLVNDKRKLIRPDYNPNNLLFIRPENGLPISNDGLNSQLSSICKKLGIISEGQQSYTSHALRHTHASMLLYQNRDITYVSKRLGHENVTTTYKTYVHVLKEVSARNDSALDGIVTSLINGQK